MVSTTARRAASASIWRRRVRGLLAINLAAASAGALVIVNTAVYVQAVYGLDNQAMASAPAAFGGGSMVAALALPKLLDSIPDRTAMLGGDVAGGGNTGGGGAAGLRLAVAAVFLLGVGYSTAQTPSGRLLRRSANPEDRPALFAAQFALSHACWLIAYPLAGCGPARSPGLLMTAIILAALAAVAIGIGFAVWSADDPEVLEHGQRRSVGRPSASRRSWAWSTPCPCLCDRRHARGLAA